MLCNSLDDAAPQSDGEMQEKSRRARTLLDGEIARLGGHEAIVGDHDRGVRHPISGSGAPPVAGRGRGGRRRGGAAGCARGAPKTYNGRE